jgi:predicted patatin/cPLA2 family phospholipase
MIFEGSVAVIDAIKAKKCLMEKGKEHGHIRPLIICGGGLMKGVYGAGGLMALAERGYKDVFTDAVGISSGVPALAYFLAGDAQHIKPLAQFESCSSDFLKPFDFKNTVNIDYFLSVLKGSTGKGIGFKKLLESCTKLHIVVSEFKTGKAYVGFVDSLISFTELTAATISIPGVVTKKAFINGVRYADGASTCPYAMDVAYDQIDATHVLVVMNQEKGVRRPPLFEYIINNTLLRFRMSPKLLAASNRRHAAREKFAHRILSSDMNACVVWGDNSISSYENNPEKIAATIEKSRIWWHELFKD